MLIFIHYEIILKDFKVIAEASIVYLYDIDKLERLNTLNQSLSQVENCKEISKWTMKHVSNTIKQKLEISKLNKHYQANLGLNETKSIILKELFEKHLVSLKDKLDNQNLMISQLVDMEWKFGVTASTNTIDKLGNAFLQLKLHYNRGDRVETSFMGIFIFIFAKNYLKINEFFRTDTSSILFIFT